MVVWSAGWRPVQAVPRRSSRFPGLAPPSAAAAGVARGLGGRRTMRSGTCGLAATRLARCWLRRLDRDGGQRGLGLCPTINRGEGRAQHQRACPTPWVNPKHGKILTPAPSAGLLKGTRRRRTRTGSGYSSGKGRRRAGLRGETGPRTIEFAGEIVPDDRARHAFDGLDRNLGVINGRTGLQHAARRATVMNAMTGLVTLPAVRAGIAMANRGSRERIG